MEEIWKDIPNFVGYQVSNLGKIRTHNKVTYTKRHGKRRWKDRTLKFKGETYKTGYRVDLWKDGKPYTLLVARLVAFVFLEKDMNDRSLTVNHKDGNRLNNNINNLELISLADNIRHAFDTGLMPYKKVEITNKSTGEKKIYRSMSKASKIMHYNHGYISSMIKKNIFENDNFIWKLI